ncbi:hypothetical protein XELAEV_18032656mg [Xenopus laevis]|uniref:Uncharacterized protein n=2 Tax=Xenopus laevis TaxID=8355 RepID=A0A974CIC5_XENLA|nr:LOC397846 protein [Xenopus laevis]OCT73693.1 hypothetical protein XELAEV_18032656mg [Xenopus laevis]
MAAADLRDELSCSICLSIYTDPVMLPCGHNYCRGCIGKTWDTQKGSGAYSCPECRQEFKERPALQRNRTLGNIAERFCPTEIEQKAAGIFCTYCVLSSVPAAKSCLLCEASLCETHLKVHSKSAEHVLTQPIASFIGRKCSVHHKVLEYYCCEDGACICVSCCLAGKHRGHKVELLSEASEKKKEKLREVLEKLRPERVETVKAAQKLEERRREVAEKAAGETERVTALFRDIREQLETLENRLLGDLSSQKEKITLTLTDLMEQLEIKKNILSRKIRHIEELCNMADPFTIPHEWELDEVSERDDIKVPTVVYLNVDRISETLLAGLTGIVNGLKGKVYGLEATDLLLDLNTAGNHVCLSRDRKSASFTLTDQHYPPTSERFMYYAQVLSTRSFSSGRHYWEVEGSKLGGWAVGVAYTSIERGSGESGMGNDKSWCLYKRDTNNIYTVRHDRRDTDLPYAPSCWRIRISLNYETGRLSFYELSEPIRHLHTFTVPFSESLNAAFRVWGNGAVVKIIS